MAKRFGKVKTYSEWCKPKLVTNALELLDKEIPKYKDQIKFVHLCFMTDPFMYKHPEVRDMTLKIIEKLNKNKIKCTVLTKGVYPLVLTNKKKYGKDNEYGITLVSLNKKFKERFEPYSASFEARINSLKQLSDVGLKTWVSIEPYPTSNIVEQDLSDILNKLSFVDKIIFGKMNYNAEVSKCDDPMFYELRASEIVRFCREHDIEYHIKFGTRNRYDKETEAIFEKPVVSRGLPPQKPLACQ
jgi:DNA repair photolyase